MSSRYQTVFTILGDDTQGLALLDDVRDFVRNAIADQFGNPQSATADEGEWNNINGHLEIDADRRDHSGFFTLSWKRPDDWELRWRLSTQGDAVEVDVQVVGPDGSGRTAGPPRLLTDILERYTCRLHGEDLPYEAVRISRENANWYANSVVFNPDRRIPVVAISEQHQGGTGGKLDKALLYLRGVALIVTTSDSDSRLINRGLGRLACSGGEIRVYRPGASIDDVPELHPTWRPSETDWDAIRNECTHILSLNDSSSIYHEVREEILRLWETEREEQDGGGAEDAGSSERIAALEKGLASARVALEKAGTKIAQLKAADEESKLTIDSLLSDINDTPSSATALHQMRERIDTLTSERDGHRQKLETLEDQTNIIAGLRRDLVEAQNNAASLTSKLKEAEELAPSSRNSGRQRKKIAQLEKKISQLEEKATADQIEIRRLQSNNERLARRVIYVEPDRTLGEEAASDFAPADDDAQPKSVFEVVRQHQDLPNIRFLQSAFDSAESSPYQHLNLLDAALRAVSECGVARATGPLGMTVEQWFRQEPEGPIDYRPRESGQTNTRHPRIWEDDRCGQELNMQEHIALGGGGRARSQRCSAHPYGLVREREGMGHRSRW